MSVKNSTFIGGFSLIKISDGLLHLLGTRQCLKLYPARVITGTRVLGACMRVEFQKITKLSVQNSIFIGDLFLIEVSNGLLHPLGSRQRVKLYPARVLPVTPVFRSLHVFRVHNDHLNECTK